MVSSNELRMIAALHWERTTDRYIDIELECRKAATEGKRTLKYHWPEIVENHGKSNLTNRQIQILYTLNSQGIKTGFDTETMSLYLSWE